MNFRVLFLLVGIVAFWGCQESGSSNNPTLPSGYEYILHTSLSDAKKAEPEGLAFFRYAMRNDEGVVISNFADPAPQIIPIPSANPGRELNPVEEALSIMGEGDSLTIVVPLDTIPVGERPQGFENSSNLFYDLKLETVKLKADLEAKVAEMETFVNDVVEQYNNGTLENIQTTESGLKYVIHEEGTGENPNVGDFVYVDYYGALLDKTAFDNSFQRGTPFAFQIGQGRVIQGWDEGIALLKPGAKATLFVPSDLGYGEAGAPPAIPGNSELAFFVNLISFVTPQ